jgi:hypothetical protein
MTGKGGATSAPPAINHQRRGQALVGVNQRTAKSLRAGFMVPIMKG